ncbi:MAG: hypothetical protein VX444_05040 [Pseudomonadota bacterium]|nr:hypothetical protein [Pseudomonadota bacterium]
MSEQMKVSQHEHGLVRIFVIDLSAEEIDGFRSRSFSEEDDHWPLRDALGATYLDEDFIEVFDVADLEDLGLYGYMRQGLGVSAADLADMKPQIDAISGHVLVVLSSAFDGFEQTLHARAPLLWLGTFKEETAPVQFKPLASEAARGSVADTPPPKTNNPHLTLLAAIVALPIIIGLLALLAWLVLR